MARLWEIIFWLWLIGIMAFYYLQYFHLASLFLQSYADRYFPFLAGALA